MTFSHTFVTELKQLTKQNSIKYLSSSLKKTTNIILHSWSKAFNRNSKNLKLSILKIKIDCTRNKKIWEICHRSEDGRKTYVQIFVLTAIYNSCKLRFGTL